MSENRIGHGGAPCGGGQKSRVVNHAVSSKMEVEGIVMSRKSEIVVIGFPKCGTTALMNYFEKDIDTEVLRTPQGAMEMAWPAIKDLTPAPHEGILVHKFTAYIYSREALEYLRSVNPDSIIVLCIRDPKRALISWRKMHQHIAQTGISPDHFAYKARDFYAECSIEEYYEKFAKQHLQYDRYFAQLLEIIPAERIVVVSQERMAKDLGLVAAYLKAIARGERAQPVKPAEAADAYKGYADRAKDPLPAAIQNELTEMQRNLRTALTNSRARLCL